MVPAHERVAVHLAFAEQRALVRTATLITAEPALRSYHNEVQPIRRQGEGPVADEVTDLAETFPGRLLDLVLERSCGRC